VNRRLNGGTIRVDETLTSAAPSARSVDAGRGVDWWREAWALFRKNAGMWIVLALIMLAIFIVLGFIPLLGGIASALIYPPIVAGWMLAARKAEGGGGLEVGDLFAGFKDKLTPLLILGALLLAAGFVIALIAGALGFGTVMGIRAGGAHGSAGGMMAALGAGMLALLVALALGLFVAMAIWFAPALIVFRNLAPVDALKASFSACLKNIVPFLLYSIVYIIAAIVATIPFGLGWIVLVPVTMHTLYVSYQDVFSG
jgi:uncharacterized membrane protein